jgi:hypothetical protein
MPELVTSSHFGSSCRLFSLSEVVYSGRTKNLEIRDFTNYSTGRREKTGTKKELMSPIHEQGTAEFTPERSGRRGQNGGFCNASRRSIASERLGRESFS